jgi:beta-lactam-binding protein with PASTA domain
MRSAVRYALLVLVLLLVFAFSALSAMRFAIHGRETVVPKLTGLTTAEAERLAQANGLLLQVENRFYSDVAAGRIVSQLPAEGARVRRGWPVRVAESLGAQRRTIPNVVGASRRAAEINLRRRGLDIAAEATVALPGAEPESVVAQSPAPEVEASSPSVQLLVATAGDAQFVMPDFSGRPLAEALRVLQQAGFGNVKASAAAGAVAHQSPAAGQRVTPSSAVYLEAAK